MVSVYQGVADISLVIPVVMGVLTDILDLFMTPPLIFFTGALFALIAFRIAVYLLRGTSNMAGA